MNFKKSHFIRLLPIIFGSVFAAYWGISRAIALRWIGDDAFISFRYARNLIEGRGLIFNIGERVEGYTNFLWTMLISGGMVLGIDPVTFGWVWGIGSYIITAAVLGWFSYRTCNCQDYAVSFIIPLAFLSILLHRDMQVWATGGLETSFLTMLITLGYVSLVLARSRGALIMAGVFFAAASLTRPDALVLFFAAVTALLIFTKKPFKSLLDFVLPVAIIFIPYWLWRWSYYGYFFPNTFYAKSADSSYVNQGLMYLWLFIKTYWGLLLYPVIIAGGMAVYYRKKNSTERRPDMAARSVQFGLVITVFHLIYVIKVGGDFMFARFFIPIIPLVFIMIESSLRIMIKDLKWLALSAILVIGTVLVRCGQFPNGEVISGITEERYHYPREKIERARKAGEIMKECLEDTEARAAFFGTHAMVVYYSEIPIAIESDAGLTDEYIAHQALKKRGRIGHEKKAPAEYLYGRKINFLLKGSFPIYFKWDTLRAVEFGDYRAFLLTFENKVMDKLGHCPNVKFTDIRPILDNYLIDMEHRPENEIRQDYAFFKAYYFNPNRDTLRERVFTNRLRK